MKKRFIFLLIVLFITIYVIHRQNFLIKIPKEDRILKQTSISILKSKVVNVISGNVFELDTGESVRLYGIDSPELDQECILKTEIKNENNEISIKEEIIKCGLNSKLKLIELILNKKISCIIKGEDGYSRYIGDCKIEIENRKKKYKMNINKEMVLSGNSIAYQAHTDKYIDDENIAKNANIGIWATTFENPFEYRKRKNLNK